MILWSDDQTTFAGTITARGAGAGGNGGFAEVSGKARLSYSGFTDLSAPRGAVGTLLLDPYNLTISSDPSSGLSGFNASADNSVLNATTLLTQLATANVTVTTGSAGSQAGDITVTAPLSWTAATTLTLNAARSIAVNAPISFGGTAGAGLTLTAGQAIQVNSTITVNGAGAVGLSTGSRAILNASGGAAATIEDYAFGNGATITFRNADGSASSTNVTGQSLTINGNAYTLLYAMADVQGINASNSGRYALAAPLDAGGTSYTSPLAGVGTVFTGTFAGLGNTISNLTISTTSASAGLFGSIGAGTVRDISLTGGSVTSSASSPKVGTLVGTNSGTIFNAFTTGSATGQGAAAYVGGLAGWNPGGVIAQSFATGAATGGGDSSTYVGGLVGFHSAGLITQSFATGTVTGGTSTYVGGLVGLNGGSILQSSAMGAASGGAGAGVGGLVGLHANGATIAQSYATGAVSTGSGGNAGGLIGLTSVGNATVTQTTWDTQTTGRSNDAGFGSTGSTGLTTAQLQSGTLPAGFSTAAWAAGAGLYPYLLGIFPNGPQVVKGMVYRDAGATVLPGAAVGIASGAGLFATATSGANGAFYAFGRPGSLTNGQSFVAFTGADARTGAQNAATLASATGVQIQTGVNIYGDALTVPTAQTLLSASPTLAEARTTALAAASAPAAVAAINGAAGRGLLTTGAFTIDEAVTTGNTFFVGTPSGQALTVAQPVTLSAGGALGLVSGGALQINADIAVNGAGTVNLGTGSRAILNASGGTAATIEDYAFGNGASLSFRNADGSAATTNVTGQSLIINGNAPTLIYSMAQFDGVDGRDGVTDAVVTAYGSGLSGRYALARSLDAAGTTYTRSLIGRGNDLFIGSIAGLGNTISNLTINSPSDINVGLIGGAASASRIRDIGLVGGSVTGGGNSPNVGALVGFNFGGLVAQSFATTSVSGQVGNVWAGGLVGDNAGTITHSWAGGTVAVGNGANRASGGLVGHNRGLITQSFAMGPVTSGTGILGYIGGLVGLQPIGGIVQSYATGKVTGGSVSGGLVGSSTSTIVSSVWDTQTTGLSAGVGSGSAAGTTGLTTTQLQSGTLPTGFDAAAWGAGAGLYPYLRSAFPNGPQAVSGTAYSDLAGIVPLASGANGAVPVTVLSGNRSLGTATTGANGYWYAFMPPGTLTAGQGLVAYVTPNAATGATNSATAAPATGATVQTGIDLIASVYRQRTNTTTLSAAPGEAEAANFTAFAAVAANATGRLVGASGPSFLIDTAVTHTGLLQFLALGPLTVAAPVNATGRLNLLGSNITLAAGGTVSGASPTLNASGGFINQAGATAVTATDAGGRWLIYTANPSINTYGGLDSGNAAVWGTAGGGAVAVTGNRYVFALQPSLTVRTTDVQKTYGDDATATVAAAYTIEGLQPGITGAFRADTVSGAPAVTSPGSAITAAVGASPYAITATLGTLQTPPGFGTTSLVNAGQLTVARRTITASLGGITSRVYDGTIASAATLGFAQGQLITGDAVTASAASTATTRRRSPAQTSSPPPGSRSGAQQPATTSSRRRRPPPQDPSPPAPSPRASAA